jgi:hypothetical protein
MALSDRKLAANRTNAQRSTGPRTTAGKARAAQNAARHGLNRPWLQGPEELAEAEVLVWALAGGRPDHLGLAWDYAERQLYLRRLWRVRNQVIRDEVRKLEAEGVCGTAQELEALAVGRAVRMLLKICGYERKAISRLAKTGRELEEILRSQDLSVRSVA